MDSLRRATVGMLKSGLVIRTMTFKLHYALCADDKSRVVVETRSDGQCLIANYGIRQKSLDFDGRRALTGFASARRARVDSQAQGMTIRLLSKIFAVARAI